MFTYIDDIGAGGGVTIFFAAFICIHQPTNTAGITQKPKSIRVDQFQRNGPKFGKTLHTCESDPLCAKTPAIPEMSVVRIEIMNPLIPNTSPDLSAFMRESGEKYHQVRSPTTIAAKIMYVMYWPVK